MQADTDRMPGAGRALALSFVLGAAIALGAGGAAAQSAPPPVTVELPKPGSTTDRLESTGTFAASATVKLVARVDGYLESVGFEDGAEVEKGQVLFRIEQDTYAEQLKLYQAQLDRAQTEYERQLRMIKQAATSQTRVESWRAERDAAAANVSLAKINLGYTTVTAPVAGVIGKRLVDPGNYVGPNSGAVELADLRQLDPIYLNFSINAPDALEIRRRLLEGGKKVTVEVALSESGDYKYEGTLDYVDPGIDASSGTIGLRAVLANPENLFLPGQFAHVRVSLGKPRSILTIPNRAVQRDQAGDYVLVVDSSGTARQKRVQLGAQSGESRAILSGLTKDDRVIVNGIAYVRDGQPVTVAGETK